jgi:hypothetical protein
MQRFLCARKHGKVMVALIFAGLTPDGGVIRRISRPALCEKREPMGPVPPAKKTWGWQQKLLLPGCQDMIVL